MPTKEGARGIGLDAGRVGALTPKRRKVYMMANQGDAPAAIARKLKITRSAVYSHMRHLRQAGLLPDSEPAATTNGQVSDLDDQVVDILREHIGATEQTIRSLDHDIEASRAEIEEMVAKRDEEIARRDRYQRMVAAA